MGHRDNFGPPPPRVGTFNPQTMIPPGNSNPHCVGNPFFPVQGPQSLSYPLAMNQSLPMPPQNLPFNSVNPSKFFNQNHSFGIPNQIQDLSQLLQLQMFNLNPQIVPGNFVIPQNVPFVGNTQNPNLGLPQNVGFHMNARPANLNFPQNVGFVGNTQLGVPDPSGVLQNMGHLIASNGTPIAAQQLLGSSGVMQGIGPVPPSQNQTNFQARPPKFQGNQRNAIENNVKNNEKPAHYKNHKQNPKHEASGNRNMKPRFQKMQNSKGKFSSPNAWIKGGKDNVGARKISVDSAIRDQAEQKRSVPLIYTDKEIQQWREERRKNYPSKANIEKKSMEKTTKAEIFDEATQLRRQRLKEVLAKQAELGCEVAEIPSYYLCDSEQQVHEHNNGGKVSNKNEKFQNRFKKRGRVDKNDRFSNKKDFAKANSPDGGDQNDSVPNKKRLVNDELVSHRPMMMEREPTLLQKLLKADIKRDKHHVMQALRFMVLNSFFKNWPKNKLEFPQVIVKETEYENDHVGTSVGGNNSRPIGKHGNDDSYKNSRLKIEGPSVKFVQEIGREEPQEEEGEIID